MYLQSRSPYEFDLLLLAFPMHFTWEILQAPLFRSMQEVSHMEGIRTCLHATLGDMAIMLLAYWLTALVAKTRHWVARPSRSAIATWLLSGLATTIALEFYSTEVTHRWTYSASMWRLPLAGTGIAPVMQWILLPLLVLWYLRRLSAAAGCSGAPSSNLADRQSNDSA